MALNGTEFQKEVFALYGGSRGFGKSEVLRELYDYRLWVKGQIQARGTGRKHFAELMEEIRREKNSGQDGTR